MRGMGNMGNMMKQMQKLQKEMEQTQKDLEQSQFVVEDNQHLVKVTMNGKKELQSLDIQEALVDPEDIEMLQDVLIATINKAVKEVEDKTQASMGQFTKGLNLPF
ncbi:YbaB/EbfC family nucleoid-associated protein [Facklamia languida]|uniref:Nucleoid-associated protein HMPREF9708_00595 n=1 Tax=Facklamia languida CCUG 37842 TaxID=883113 RepID=H3NHR0_9LACT|nr:YbaB/EbfC family nucleoid-associated protein [Facklamia languida]EHR37966.1 YbaB/EbfC family DNA-binding protein [Facklamia languida CCUG 37842]